MADITDDLMVKIMVEYCSDGSIVHVMTPDCGGEFTFCGRPTDGDEDCGGFFPLGSYGPATCAACKKAVDAFRVAMRDIRWGALREAKDG